MQGWKVPALEDFYMFHCYLLVGLVEPLMRNLSLQERYLCQTFELV